MYACVYQASLRISHTHISACLLLALSHLPPSSLCLCLFFLPTFLFASFSTFVSLWVSLPFYDSISIFVCISKSLSLSLNCQSLFRCLYLYLPLFFCLSLSPSPCLLSVSLTTWASQSLSLAFSLPLPLCLSLSEPLSLLDSQGASVKARACPLAPTSGITARDRLANSCQVRANLVSPALLCVLESCGPQPIFTPYLLRAPFSLPSFLSWT